MDKKLSILQKLFFTMILVSIIPLSTIWYINHEENTTQMNNYVDIQLTSVVKQLTTYVNGWVDMNKRMLQQNAASQTIRSMDSNLQTPLLKSIKNIYDWNYLVFTVDNSGNNIGRSDDKAPKYYGDRKYVRQVFEGSPFGKQVLIGKTSGKPALVLSTAIQDDNANIKGVLAIAMTISELSEQIANTRIGSTGKAFLLDEEGKVIAHQTLEYSSTRKDFSTHPAFIGVLEGKKHVQYEDEHGEQVTAYMWKTDEGWIMVAQQDISEAFSIVDKSNRDALILLVSTILVVSFIAFLLAKRLSNPIRNLTQVANEISRGNFDDEIPEIRRTDELGALAVSIQRLGKGMQIAMKRLSDQKTK